MLGSSPQESQGMPKREVKGDPAFHRIAFQDFIKYELAVGGPDPHMKVANWIANRVCDSDLQAAWFGGLYVAPYNVPSGEVLFHRWNHPSKVLDDQEGFTEGLSEVWKGITCRKERRAVMAPHKMAAHIIDLADFLMGGRFQDLEDAKTYDDAHEIMRTINGNGRYGTMKLYETWRRSALPGLPEQTSIVPRGAWSPRLSLSWQHPEYAEWLNGNDSQVNLDLSNSVASYNYVDTNAYLTLDWFNYEVMLCDYKQAYDGKQYPGRAHDSELGHLLKVQPKNLDVPFKTLEARAALFPHQALGEYNGWTGRRDECSDVLLHYGYTWSDMVYDYNATLATVDFANPIRRPV